MNENRNAASPEQLRNDARRQIQAGQWDAARNSLQGLVERMPQDLPAWLEWSNLLARQGRWKDSCEPLLQATRHLPRHAPMVLQLVQQLVAHGEVVAARQCLDFLARAPDPPVELLKAQAGYRSMLKEYVSARELLERALAAGADDPDSHYMHGMLLHFVGDMDQACLVLERCMERWPQYADAALLLVNLRRQTEQANLLDHVDAQLADLRGNANNREQAFARAKFEYVRFKTLDDLDRREAAWLALEHFNRHMHELCPHDAEGESAEVDALLHSSAAGAGAVEGVPAPGGPVPIFIVGMPRSGTTLLERMLSAHSRIGSAGEIVDFRRQLRTMTDVRFDQPRGMLQAIERSDRIDFGELGARYLRQTQWHADGSDFYIDKLPSNIQMVGFIRRALPHARIVHMVRDPMDTCFSNFRSMFGNTAAYSYDMDALARHYRQYVRVVEHWHRQFPGTMLDVAYADLVDDTENALRRVLAHCGLEMEGSCLHPERNASPVATRSSAQVREPVHRRGLGGWKRYESQLQPLRRALGELAKA